MRKTKVNNYLSTDDFEIGRKVRVTNPGEFLPCLKDMTGTVIMRDRYTVEVRMDKVTEEMEGFSDAKTGVINFAPDDLELI